MVVGESSVYFYTPDAKEQIVSLEIDPLQRSADVNRKNNLLVLSEAK